MHAMPSWNLDATSILTRRELAADLADFKAPRAGWLTRATWALDR